ncbi:EAL domain-containing protein [Rubrivivax gelatinosus]|uniref:EAL domain-containing protein n=2 Tax=Rubrivivax gelatinosus TaxID=28068 RepID=UPI003D31F3CC
MLLPLTLFGVIARLLGDFPIPAGRVWLEHTFGPGWRTATNAVVQSTWGVLGLALCITIAAVLTRRTPPRAGSEPLPPAWVAVCALLNFALFAGDFASLGLRSFGLDSLLLGIVVGVLTPTLLRPLADWGPMRRLSIGYDTSSVFHHSSRLALPMMVLGLLFKGVAGVFVLLVPTLIGMAQAAQPTPRLGVYADWLVTPATVLLHQLLWFFGVHGGAVLHTSLFPLLSAVIGVPVQDRVSVPLIYGFSQLGGSGATLGLLFALLIVAREGQNRRLAQLSGLPALFNVNELLLFGLPLVLNRQFLLPFVLVPVLLTLPPLLALHAGWITLLPVYVPWTTPVLLSGWLLTGSWVGVALQLFGLLVSTLIYLPFVRRSEAERLQLRATSYHDASAAIVAGAPRIDTPLRRSDHVGVIARGLLHDLERSMGSSALSLAYQPQQGLDGRPIGVEALLRWTHPGYGPVRTDVAIALAEQGGLIGRLGAWALDEACARKAQWNRQGLQALTMSVNVSPLQLGEPGLPAVVARALERHGLRPDELELEITESRGIPSGEVADRNLAGLEALGVRLAMDDFGMGHASLLHLKRFRVAAIKVDGSLSRDVMSHPVSGDIIRAIATLGHSSGARVIAEFVETREQRDRLAALGCDVFQGYLYSPALAPDLCLAHLQRSAAPASTALPVA